MSFLVANNVFTAQGSHIAGDTDGWGHGPNSGFGHSTVYMANVDRIFMSAIDGSQGYQNDVWWYDIDLHEWTRRRPTSSLAHSLGGPASEDGTHDYFAPAWGDNTQHAYVPDIGMVVRWGGNGTGISTGEPARSTDQTWASHVHGGGNPTAGVYLYNPLDNTWTMPYTAGYGGVSGSNQSSTGCGWDPDRHRIMQFFGFNENGGDLSRVAEIDLTVNPPGGTITSITGNFGDGFSAPIGRENCSYQSVYHSRARKWICFGGCTTPYTQYFNDTWMWDAARGTWTNLNPTGNPPARAFGLMWYDERNNVILITAGEGPGHAQRTDVWEFSLEQCRWKQHSATFDRNTPAFANPGSNSGGVIFDSARNAAFFTGAVPGSMTQDVFSFRYAIPRISIATSQWYAYRKPDHTVGIDGSDKHLRPAHCPANGSLYFCGGDYAFAPADEVFVGGSSYSNRLFSLNLGQRFADPTNRNAGCQEEYGWSSSGTDIQPKRPDYISFQWDPIRGKMLFAPGLQVPGYAGAVTLVSGITSGQLVFSVTTTSEIPPGIGSSTLTAPFTGRLFGGAGFDSPSLPVEDITVSGIVEIAPFDGSTYQVTASARGVNGTTAVAHSAGWQFAGVGDGYPYTPANGTLAKADDPNYYHRHFLHWNVSTVKWENFAFNPNSIQSAGTWSTWLDPILNGIWKFYDEGGNFQAWFYNIAADTWTQHYHALAGNVSLRIQPWTMDPQRRVAYIADREFGKFYSYALDTDTFTIIGDLPHAPGGTSIFDGSGGRPQGDKGYIVFDWFSRLVFYDARDSSAAILDTIWFWNPDAASPAWVQLTTVHPTTGIGGEAIPAGDQTPHATGLTYDPLNHVVHFFGTQTGTSNEYGYADQYSYVYRATDIGVAAAPSTLPTVDLLSPSSCFVGSSTFTLTITGTLFTSGAVANWDGVPLTGTVVVSPTRIDVPIPAGLVLAIGIHTISVTTALPGGDSVVTKSFTVGAPPATVSLAWNGIIRDRVAGVSLIPDGQLDGVFTLTFTALLGRTVTKLRLDEALTGGVWNTTNTGNYVLGVALTFDSALLNNGATQAVNFTPADGSTVALFASKVNFPQGLVPGNTEQVTVSFSDTTSAQASIVIGGGQQFTGVVGDSSLGMGEVLSPLFIPHASSQPIVEVDLTQQPGLHASIRRG